jgi:nicotinamide mononucleotide transporter
LSALEVVGTVAGVLSVLLTVRRNLWCWPVGIVSVGVYAVLFFQIRLYADAALQVFYVGTGFYGWYAWRYGGAGRSELPVRMLSGRERLALALLLAPVIVLVTAALRTWTDASLPFWDTLASSLSVAAQLLLMRKILENWILWIVVDVLSVGIYVAKGVYLTSALYAVYLLLAVLGWRAWRRPRVQP